MKGVIKIDIQIGLNKGINVSEEYIKKYFSDNKINITKKYYDMGYMFNIECIKKKFINKDEFINIVSNIILDIILDKYSKDAIKKQINSIYHDFNFKDKEEIIQISEEILLSENNFKMEKKYFNDQIRKYLKNKKLILLEGFIKFRLKGFDLFIDMVVDKGIDELTAEKEYNEFINILQYFVESQEAKYNIINIIFDENDYKLLDENDKIINNDVFNEVVAEIDSDEISKDDLLISSLIVMAPKKLIIHFNETRKNQDIIKILTSVFQDKVYLCLGCSKCSTKIQIKDGKQYRS